MAFRDMLFAFEHLDVFGVLLPFILIFAIVFAVFSKLNIFGEKNKQVAVVVALVMALTTVWAHVAGIYPPNRDPVNIINSALPSVSVIVVAIVMALLIIGVMGGKWELAGGSLSGWIAFLAFALIVYVFGSAAEWWQTARWLYFLQDPDLVALIVTVLVFAIIIWFITKDDKDSGGGFFEKFGEALKTHVK